MIHLISIDSKLTPQVLAKLARQKGMTGGFELEINSTLSTQELETILATYIEALSTDEGSAIERLWSNAGRVLTLLKDHKNLKSEHRQLIETLLQRLQ